MANLTVLPNPATKYSCLEAGRCDGKHQVEYARRCIEDKAGYVGCIHNPNNRVAVCADDYSGESSGIGGVN